MLLARLTVMTGDVSAPLRISMRALIAQFGGAVGSGASSLPQAAALATGTSFL